MDSFNTILNILIIGLKLNYYEPKQVINWADDRIFNESQGYEAIIDISVAPNNKRKILEKLESLAQNRELNKTKKFYFGYIYNLIHKEPDYWNTLEKEVFKIGCLIGLNDFISEEKEFLSSLEDDIFLRKNNHGRLLNMPNDLINFLGKFSKEDFKSLYDEILNKEEVPHPKIMKNKDQFQ